MAGYCRIVYSTPGELQQHAVSWMCGRGARLFTMAITFLHAADIHLDSPLKGLERYENAPVERIRGATRRAFTRLIDLAIEKKVDFVLIAGDLYDGDWRDYNTGLYLVRQLGRLREQQIPVFVIAGNHDAANKMTRALRLPENVRLLAHEHPETVRLEEHGVAIHGQSFGKIAVLENLAAAYPAPLKGYANIGLLHTGMGGVDGHERYAPCTLEDLRARGYDYWALGHIHNRQILCKEPLIVFAGNVQGRHIRETGPKGCLLVTVHSNHRIESTFQRLDHVRWERACVDVRELETDSDILGRASEVLDELLATETEPDAMLVVRVILSGPTPLHSRLQTDPERSIAEIRSLATERGRDRLWIERVALDTQPVRTVTMPDGPFDELQEVIEQLRSDRSSMTTVVDELAELKRKLPAELTQDPEGPQLNDTEWLQTLLVQVQPMLLDLLLKADNGDINSYDAK
jgi:DNA repair exonuclease SbcCD nuclease subunit